LFVLVVQYDTCVTKKIQSKGNIAKLIVNPASFV